MTKLMTHLPTRGTNTTQPGETELIALAAQGNAKAFRVLVNQYLPLVYNYLFRMTQNHELSEEMAQEAFVKAYQNLKTFDRTRAFKPWLLRIATNATLSELRKQKKVVSLNALEEEGGFNEADHQSTEDITIQLERQLTHDEVQQAMTQLAPKYRQALLMRYQQEMSYEEIADAMQIPLNTTRTWLKRGLEKLKQAVKEVTT
jgi:RNA polymerase sigma-70 factor (ECF subfamily)